MSMKNNKYVLIYTCDNKRITTHNKKSRVMYWCMGQVMSHMNESCPTLTSHFPYGQVQSHMNESCPT